MSIHQTETVDAIGLDTVTNDVVLTVLDSVDWSAEGEHICLLQEKLNSYLRFLESGEIEQVYPAACGRKRRINIVARCEPTAAGLKFLKNAREAIEAAGFALTFDLKPSG